MQERITIGATMRRPELSHPAYGGTGYDDAIGFIEAHPANPIFRDQLTGLANRSYFMIRLEEAIWLAKHDESYGFSVLALNVANLKKINAGLGYAAGDQLLMAIAHRLETNLEPRHTVARLGGDKFAILLDGISWVGNALEIAQHINDTLSRPYVIFEQETTIRMNIGVTVSHEEYSHADEMLSGAELAMEEAKATDSRNNIVFDETLHEKAARRLRLEAELRYAIEHHELVVYYQPIISLKTDQITGLEALVRWNHPERGLIEPSEFIPLAEGTELITAIDEWMARTACQQLKAWHEQGHTQLHIAVNFSRRDFQDKVAQHFVDRALQESQIPADRLEIEVTESMAMADKDLSAEMFNVLMANGIRIAMDDFGTGYSSLACLGHLPINTVKIDRAFVADLLDDPRSEGVLKAIIEIAHSLGLTVVAEGVETKEQLDFLRSQNCDLAQGYLFSRPVPVDTTTALLEKQRSLNGIRWN